MPQLRHFCHIRTLLISLIASVMATQAFAIEEPVYQVEKVWEAEQIEIRAYAPRVMAVTGMNEDSNGGFKVLAGYIFGGNAEEEKIAMTAPVQQSMAGEKEMAFMMPAEYALEDLPRTGGSASVISGGTGLHRCGDSIQRLGLGRKSG